MPLGTFLVARTDWPVAVRTVAGGIFVFGPEIMMFPAIALMGKENFNRIISWTKGILKTLQPTGSVSSTRYRIGLVLLIVPTVFSWITSYIPSWLPGEKADHLWINLGLDLTIVVSLFVLGGDFWDKLRGLFLYDAKVTFPAPTVG